MVSDKSIQISNAFHKFVETGNQSLISGFSRQQIEFAVTQYTNSVDSNAPFYHAMQKRVAELKEQEESKRKKSEIWADRIITFIIGILSGLIVAYLVWKFKMN